MGWKRRAGSHRVQAQALRRAATGRATEFAGTSIPSSTSSMDGRGCGQGTVAASRFQGCELARERLVRARAEEILTRARGWPLIGEEAVARNRAPVPSADVGETLSRLKRRIMSSRPGARPRPTTELSACPALVSCGPHSYCTAHPQFSVAIEQMQGTLPELFQAYTFHWNAVRAERSWDKPWMRQQWAKRPGI